MSSTELSRRGLLIGAGAAGIGLTAFGAAAGLGLQGGGTKRKAGIAILGLGGYATRQILPAFKDCESAQPVALISGTPDKLTKFGDEYGIPKAMRFSYAEMDRIKEIPEIDAVYVITPPGTHLEYTARSARAGKHVLCEKPMEIDSKRCREMVEACRRADRLLMIGYRSHYEAHNLRAIEACRSGELGTLRSIVSEHGFQASPGTWRLDRELSGGGALWDIGIYAVQAALYLSGEEPTSVVALGDKLKGDDRYAEVDDVTHMVLKFPGGVTASVSTGYSWAGANNYRVIGTKQSLVADPATAYSGHRLRIGRNEVEVKANNQFAAMLDHFGEAILTGKKTTRTPGEMGVRDIVLMEAALRAAREGRAVATA